MTGRVAGKVALITGAARGMGRSHAVRLAQEGADIIALDLCEPVSGVPYPGATPADLARTAELVASFGRRVVAGEVDVRDRRRLTAAVAEAVAELGRLDIVCANAAVFMFGRPAHETDEADWDTTLDINLKGVWLTVRATAPILIEQGTGGSVILISSTAGLHGAPNCAAYAASKHGVVGLSRTLALELGPHAVRVNTVHPTSVPTDMVRNAAVRRLFVPDRPDPTDGDVDAVMARLNALPTPWVEARDVSDAVLYLASDESRYVTGLELKVDAGGLSK